SCHNLLGNILMNQSRLDESLVEYRRALRIRTHQREDVRFSIGILLDNIGYVWLLKRRFRRGESVVRRGLTIQTAIGAPYSIAECLQDLCYARMQQGDYEEAMRLGERSLDLAREHSYANIEKNCYYLLGETAHLAGRLEDRDRYFARLQGMHPELPFLHD